jgi:two-component system cell cycle response regulator
MTGNSIKVLIVEDSPTHAILVEKMLASSKSETFNIDKAENMSESLQKLDEKEYDVILSDLFLPDSNGRDTYLKLNERAPDVPIILLTVLDNESFALQLIKEGAQDYLIKGKINLENLMRSIRYAVERSALIKKIRGMTLVDDLTGLYNARGFKALAEKHLNLAKRLGMSILIYFIDIDGMKYINDTFGHNEGNEAIKNTANILKATFRESDVISRLGGDEFVVLLMEKGGLTSEILDSRLQNNIQSFNLKNKGKYEISISSGFSRYTLEKPVSLDELLEEADRLMYENKRKKDNHGN